MLCILQQSHQGENSTRATLGSSACWDVERAGGWALVVMDAVPCTMVDALSWTNAPPMVEVLHACAAAGSQVNFINKLYRGL